MEKRTSEDTADARSIMRHYERLIFKHRVRKYTMIMSFVLVISIAITAIITSVALEENVYAAQITVSPIVLTTEAIKVEAVKTYTQPAQEVVQPVQQVVAQNLVATPETFTSVYIVNLTNEEMFQLCQLAVVEAGGEGEDGCVAVMATAINRYFSPDFPNTINGVITQSGQFAKCSNVSAAKIAEYPFMMNALDRAMRGEDPAGMLLGERSLYFYSNIIQLSSTEQAMRDRISNKVLLGNQWFYGATGNAQGNREL